MKARYSTPPEAHRSGEPLLKAVYADPGNHGFYYREEKPDSVAMYIRSDLIPAMSDDMVGDSRTLQGFIKTHGCTPSMMHSRARIAEKEADRLREQVGALHALANELSWDKKTRDIADRIRAALSTQPAPVVDAAMKKDAHHG